jgi:predicted membrane protein
MVAALVSAVARVRGWSRRRRTIAMLSVIGLSLLLVLVKGRVG